jgi:hypothetical protein
MLKYSRKKRACYFRKYRRKNELVRKKETLNRLLRSFIKGKNSPTIENLLGCSRDNLIKYFQELFDSEMNWENHGKVWHIDHAKPCSLFNLAVDDELRKCYHFTNLQPLPAKQNLQKNKYLSLIN